MPRDLVIGAKYTVTHLKGDTSHRHVGTIVRIISRCGFVSGSYGRRYMCDALDRHGEPIKMGILWVYASEVRPRCMFDGGAHEA